MKMDNKIILAVIAVAVIGIFAVLLIQFNKRTPAEKVSDSISHAIDKAGEDIK